MDKIDKVNLFKDFYGAGNDTEGIHFCKCNFRKNYRKIKNRKSRKIGKKKAIGVEKIHKNIYNI
ncbi:MAG: hypothetical protein K6F97_04605 [Lachnospiraceae bacterium]|nr:hypothetical protein [Lachnospiraceae bacterium]